MSCPALTNKGGKLYISDQPVDCDLTLSELAVLDYLFVPGVGSIGDTGIEQDVVTYPTTDAGLTAQGKGDSVARNWDIEVLDAPSQARDILDEASAIGNDDNYATRIEWPNGDVEFSIVQVASRTAVKGAASGVRVLRYSMTPVSTPIVTGSTPEALGVMVSGDYNVGSILTASYEYYSPLGLPESGSRYQWYADGVAIPGADDLTYVIDEEYEGAMISFGVEPSDGLTFGDEVFSNKGGPVTDYAPESLALFAAMSPQPSLAQAIAIDAFLKDAWIPIWDKVDAIYILHSYDEQPSLLNWKNPAESAVPVNSPTFHEYSGWQGDGVSAYVTIPTILDRYTLNDAHVASSQALSVDAMGNNWRYIDNASNTAAIRSYLVPRNSSDFVAARLNNNTTDGPTSLDQTALLVVNRDSAPSFTVYRDGIVVMNVVRASSELPTLPFGLLGNSNIGQKGNMRPNIFSFGSALTPSEIISLNNAWSAYKASMVSP